jgi:hypothetical protein
MYAIHKAAYWISLWCFLLPKEQQGYMDSGCTRLMAVIRAIFSQVVGSILREYKMHSLVLYSFLAGLFTSLLLVTREL